MMTWKFIKQALPGIVLVSVLGICLAVPALFEVVNLVVLWIGFITLGIPTLVASPVLFILYKFKNTKLNAVETGLFLFILHIPAFFILIGTWLHFNPSDGPALGYMLLFYIFGIPYWLPLFIGWCWYSARKA
jgi:hypothetical protein